MKVVYYWDLGQDRIQFYELREGVYYPVGRYTNRKAQFVFLDYEKRVLPCAESSEHKSTQ